MGRKDEDEETACQAFFAWFGRQHTPVHVITDAKKLDEVPSAEKRADWSFSVRETRWVLEHTRLQAFEKRAYEDVKFNELFGRPDGMAIGPFTLVAVGGNAESFVSALENKEAILQEVVASVRALDLRPGESRTIRLSSLDFDLSLRRGPDALASTPLRIGRLSRSHTKQAEDELKVTVTKALMTKLPKLAAARKLADRSILLLESDDLATAGGWNLVPAVVKGLQATTDPVPDLVYLIETGLEQPWFTAIKHGEVVFQTPDVEGHAHEDGRWPALPLLGK